MRVIILGILFLTFFYFYNRLVRFRNLVQEGWSGIDVQLKRRQNLIPSLVEIVRGYVKHERGTLEEVTKMRTQAGESENIKEREQLESAMSGQVKKIIALVESYPDLKADKNFIDLQHSLTEIEDQIQFARRYYNGTVRDFNICIESVPANIVAKIFGFKKAEFFEIELTSERESPNVALA